MHTPTTIHEYSHFVVGLARYLGRGRVDSEDLAQDVLERWLRSAPGRAQIANPHAWMQVVLRHLLIDRLRRRRVSPVALTGCLDRVATESDVVPWWHNLEVGDVERELADLPPALGETFRLYAFEARSYKQIACQLKIAMGTVAVRISRARARLKQRLIEHNMSSTEGRKPSALASSKWESVDVSHLVGQASCARSSRRDETPNF